MGVVSCWKHKRRGERRNGFNEFTIIDQRLFIFDIIRLHPSFDLIPQALKFLDLRLEVLFQFLFLGLVGTRVDLFKDLLW